ncbi:MAG: threonine ammonia-lyase IlvA [Patescibacteria group bacterium]
MKVTVQQIDQAAKRLEGVVEKTPLQFNKRLSQEYGAKIYLKREDLQEVRSFKIRGAYNKIVTLTPDERKRGVVAASAGNHAQGVALSCSLLKMHGVIFMPAITPNQKIDRVKHFGDGYITIKLVGQTYDEASKAAHAYCAEHGAIYVHPFDDPLTIAGQGTIGKEILEQTDQPIDVVVAAIGGGGLISGVSSYLHETGITIYGVEPTGAPAMYEALQKGKLVNLQTIDTFADGVAVQQVGATTLAVCQKYVKEVHLVPEGKICTTMIELYQNEGIITEPAGALSVAALDGFAKQIKGKTVVCVISGGNNDILRYPEIMERSLVYQGRKHYLILEFTQKPGQLKQFLNEALGPRDDIVRFEYMKKTNKEKGAALVGIELKEKNDLEPLLKRMKAIELKFKILTSDELLYEYLI